MKYWPLNSYYKRSDWEIWLAERFFEVLTSNLWNKKKIHTAEAYRNGVKLDYIHPPMVKFTGKNEVGNITWAKLHSLIGQKQQNSFQ